MKVVDAPELRTDRATLRAPKVLADGSLRVEAVSVTVGEILDYPWGKEVATEAAMKDPEYLDNSRGLAITRNHVKGGRVSRKNQDKRVGTITGARYDEGEKCAIRELTISDPQTIADFFAKKFPYVSETYDAPKSHRVLREDGVTEQGKRIPNSIALTDNPRAKSAHIRTDEADMNEEEISALIAKAVKPLNAQIKELTDAQALATLVVKPEVEDVVHQDSADDIADRIVALKLRAAELRVDAAKLEGVKGEANLAKTLATELGADAARCDSLDYCHGVIDAAKAPEAKPGQKWTATLRTDTANPSKSAL